MPKRGGALVELSIYFAKRYVRIIKQGAEVDKM
jgi:hypothetical protein